MSLDMTNLRLTLTVMGQYKFNNSLMVMGKAKVLSSKLLDIREKEKRNNFIFTHYTYKMFLGYLRYHQKALGHSFLWEVQCGSYC